MRAYVNIYFEFCDGNPFAAAFLTILAIFVVYAVIHEYVTVRRNRFNGN